MPLRCICISYSPGSLSQGPEITREGKAPVSQTPGEAASQSPPLPANRQLASSALMLTNPSRFFNFLMPLSPCWPPSLVPEHPFKIPSHLSTNQSGVQFRLDPLLYCNSMLLIKICPHHSVLVKCREKEQQTNLQPRL